ncbi:GPN-loop GTPase [Gracilaria domingensis]|nr:GPN-loop GTPase [Gracilaria domingensis]
MAHNGRPSAAPAAASSSAERHDPRILTPVCLVLGMAGSGKTTLVDAFSAWLEEDDLSQSSQGTEEDAQSQDDSQLNRQIVDAMNSLQLQQSASLSQSEAPAQHAQPLLPGDGSYIINLDPAVYELPYEPNIDIRDTIKYKQVMSNYSLGPNGAIITSLNLYATRFDQVLTLIEKRAPESRAVIIDTPGQIETFTWSASGDIITEILGITLPTVILFVIDTTRCENTMTFVSNMLYACSIMYKTRLPLVIVFNKTDVKSCDFAQAWMRDFTQLEQNLKDNNFLGTLARSMAQALEEFYNTFRSVGVSAQTGEGMEQLAQCIKDAALEYEQEYRPYVEKRKKARAEEKRLAQDAQIARVRKDLQDEAGFGSSSRFEEDEAGVDDEKVEPSPSVFPDHHAVRLAKMKGEFYDEEEEQRKYDEFMRMFNEKNSESKKKPS